MTIKQIIKFAQQNGLPKDYPLRGKKHHIKQQIMRWFKSSIDWSIMAGKKPTVEEKNLRDKVAKELDIQ